MLPEHVCAFGGRTWLTIMEYLKRISGWWRLNRRCTRQHGDTIALVRFHRKLVQALYTVWIKKAEEKTYRIKISIQLWSWLKEHKDPDGVSRSCPVSVLIPQVLCALHKREKRERFWPRKQSIWTGFIQVFATHVELRWWNFYPVSTNIFLLTDFYLV